MNFQLAGQEVELDHAAVLSRTIGHHPEAIQRHWVDVDGVRWPPKQLLELSTGIPRSSFISHHALRVFQRLGFGCSEIPTRDSSTVRPKPAGSSASLDAAVPDREALRDSVDVLLEFLQRSSLTERIAQLEHQLHGASNEDVSQLATTHAISPEMLAAALTIRSVFGRVNDVIHAAVIALTLPHILEPGERITNRPSLAAGNDPTRPFDLETDRRVAEFKVSVWTGKDAMRKRGVFADLVHLALDDSGRRRQLFVVGDAPGRFLQSTTASASWGLSRGSSKLRDRFEDRFGSLDISIADVRSGRARDVEVVDLGTVLPGIDQMLSGNWMTEESE